MWPVPLTEVWTCYPTNWICILNLKLLSTVNRLCTCRKSVNRTLIIKLNCEKLLKNFSDKNDWKFKITSKKSHSSRASRALISLQYLVSILLNFLQQNCSIFHNSCIGDLNTTKPLRCTGTLTKDFPTVARAWGRGVGDLIMTNKTNKPPSLIEIRDPALNCRSPGFWSSLTILQYNSPDASHRH